MAGRVGSVQQSKDGNSYQRPYGVTALGGFPTFAPPDDKVAPIAAVRWTSGTDRAADPSAGRPDR
jgi:hypothetical protein